MQLTSADLAAMQALIDEYHLLAADVIEQHGASFLRNDDALTRYDGNHMRRIRATSDIGALFAAIDLHYLYLPYRAVRVDPFTPPVIEARLLVEEYLCETEIVMAAGGELTGRAAEIEIRTVRCDSEALARVVALDADERPGYTTDTSSHDVWALIQRRGAAFTSYVAFDGERPVGHFSQRTRGALGYLESLFVDPGYRVRGIGTALTHHAANAARAEGARVVFLPAADDTPKEMYRRMGFEPVYAFRNYRKDVSK